MGENYVIGETEVKAALIDFVSKNRCLSSKSIEEISIRGIEMKNSFLYTIRTFVEIRETNWKNVPYSGEVIDDTKNGEIPGTWEVVVPKPNPFKNFKEKFVVPHSEKVEDCLSCGGFENMICLFCRSSGRHSLYSRNNSLSHWQKCIHCNGTGRPMCISCLGGQKIKWFLQLKVEGKIDIKKRVINKTVGLPDKLVEKAVGDLIFRKSRKRVDPINNFPDATVEQASIDLINLNKKEFENETSKIIEQKHELKLVPVAVVKYEYKNKTGNFYVYGSEQLIYFPNFPGNFCKFCSIV